MAVTFVGSGAPAYGNNAAVTPGLPAGLQPGDLLLAATCIRDAVGRMTPPAGWSEVSFNVSGTAITLQFFGRIYQAGDGNPTFTPSAGGANDTTIAAIQAFRGATTTLSNIVSAAINTGTAVTSLGVAVNGTNDPMPAGHAAVIATAGNNDTSVSSFSFYAPSTPTWGGGAPHGISALSTLGADATLSMSAAGWGYTVSPGTTWGLVHTFNAACDRVGNMLIIPTGITTTTFTAPTPSGGVKAGGSAVCTFLPFQTYIGSGGIKGGGAATTGPNWLEVSGAGGAKAGGSATTVFKSFLRGVRWRATGAAVGQCGAGTITATIPAGAQVGDILFLHYGSQSDDATKGMLLDAATPPGWTRVQATGGNNWLFGYVFWRKCQAGDAGTTVSITPSVNTGTSTEVGKTVEITAFSNVDWSYNAGNPIAGFGTIDTLTSSGDVWNLRAPSNSVANSTLDFIVSMGSSALTLNATGIAEGWAEYYDVENACSMRAHIYLLEQLDSTGIRAGATYDHAIATTTNTSGQYAIAVSVVGNSNVGEHVPAGGAKAGGAAASIFEAVVLEGYWATGGLRLGGMALTEIIDTPVGNFVGSGGAKAGGAASAVVTSFVKSAWYGLLAGWSAQAASERRVLGWRVRALVDGVAVPLSHVTCRRTADQLRIEVRAPGRIAALVGQTLALEVTFDFAGAGAVSTEVMQAQITGVVSAREVTSLSAFALSLTAGSGDWAPAHITYKASGRTRCAVDWFVLPGHTLNGAILTGVTTTMGTNAPWFTEVSYG